MMRAPLEQVNRYLLRRQHLAPEAKGDDVLAVVRDICALHATATLTPYVSLWSRMRSFRPELLDHELFERRSLVRLTCMRATLHVVPSEEMPLFFQATRELQRRDVPTMGYVLVNSGLCREGEEEAMLQWLEERITAVVAERGPSTVAELREQVPEMAAKFQFAPDKPYGGELRIGTQLVIWLCILGRLVRARPRGTWRSNLYEYAPLSLWLPRVNLDSIPPAQAQAELVHRYLAALGPATPEDVAWWSGLSKAETRSALAALGDAVAEVEVEGLGSGCMLARDVEELEHMASPGELAVCLLPSLDPYIMGYKDRRRFLDVDRHSQVFDRAGNAFNTVWVNGRVVGVWQEQEALIQVLLWDELEKDAVAAEAARLGRFLLGEEAVAEVKSYPADMYVYNPYKLARRNAG